MSEPQPSQQLVQMIVGSWVSRHDLRRREAPDRRSPNAEDVYYGCF